MNNPTSLPTGLHHHSKVSEREKGLAWWRSMTSFVLADGGEHLAAAAGAAGLHALALADLHSGLVVDGGVAHALLDLAGHGQKGLLDIAGVLGRGLEEGNAEAVCELLRWM